MRFALALFAAALWWGALTGVVGLAVPVLFFNLPLRAGALLVASQFFTALLWVALACGAVLLLTLKGVVAQGHDERAVTTLGWVIAGMVLALLLEFVVAPHVRVRDQLALWGSAGAVALLLQWLCAGMCLWRVAAWKEA